MSDGRVEVDATINSNDTYKELRRLQREFKSFERQFKIARLKSIMPFRVEMFKTEKKMYELADSMGKYSGTTKEFMGNVNQLGAEFKKAKDNMINADKTIAMSMIKTAGYMMNMTTQAERITKNYERMNNPLLKINNTGLAVASTLNKMANAGNASVLALKMLGPNASMKELRDMQMMINQGIMRFQMVALAAAATSAIVYSSMHKLAMEANKGYAEAFENMKKKLLEAMGPMITVFSEVMTVVYNFISAIADLVIQFNQAHPTAAKLISAVLLLIPALTLLLSPLAIGIGLLGGTLAAWNSIWMLIGPLITGLGAMSATVWLVAGAIVALTAGIIYLWKENETFRNSIMNGLGVLKEWGIAIGSLLLPIVEKLADGIKTLGSAIKSAIEGDFSQLGQIFQQLIPSVIGFLIGGIPGIIITASRFVPAIAQGINQNTNTISATITNIFTYITSFIATKLPIFIQAGMDILTNLIQGIITALPLFINAIMTIIQTIVPTIITLLPVISQSGMQILQAIINGILMLLPTLVTTALNLIQTIITTIVTLLPMLLQTGVQLLLTIVQGIILMLPSLIDTAINLIMSVINTIVTMLPQILNTGIKLLLTLITGIINMIPQLVDSIVKIVISIVTTIVGNLPKILQMGVRIVITLVDGILRMLPQLIASILKLIVSIVNTIISNLPRLLQVGVQLILALIKGIVSMAVNLAVAAGDLALKIVEKFKGIDLLQVGKDVIQGLINGLLAKVGSLMKAASDIAGKVKEKIAGAFKIKSPSRWMRDFVAGNIARGFEIGIDRNKRNVMNTSDKLSSWMKPNISDFVNTMKMATPTFAYAVPNATVANNVTNVYNNKKEPPNPNNPLEVVLQMDSRDMARLLVDPINEEQQRKEMRVNLFNG